jgi:hypothetical protein
MLQLKASSLLQVMDRLSQATAWLSASKDQQESIFHPDRKFDEDDRAFAQSRVSGLAEHLEVLNARMTAMSAAKVAEYCQSQEPDWSGFKTRIDEVRSRLIDELTLVKVFAIEADKHQFFEPTTPLFGVEFEAKFISAAFDLSEAGKCLALGRSTACVFHLMRIMEAGIRAVARCLSIPDPIKPADRNWGKMLERIWKDGIEKRWPTVASRTTGDGQIFEALHASLDSVKNPWRNATMHVENKYTPEEAEDIFVAVRGFMRKLASRMDGQGQPLA